MTSASGPAGLGVTPDGTVIRRITAGDDLSAEVGLAHRAFGAFGSGEAERRLVSVRLSVADGRHLGAYADGTLLGAARYHDMRQWWSGRSLPMAGVAGVKVAPHAQGRGLGTALVTALLAEMAGRGYPLSVLYPMTAPVYRALGWEMAGALTEATVPARSLRGLLAPDPDVASPGAGRPGAGRPGGSGFRPAGAADAAETISVLSGLYEAGRGCGPVTFDVPHLAGLLGQDSSYLYLAPDGVLCYRWDQAKDEMQVYCAAAGSAATSRALWSIVSSHGTAVSGVRAFLSPADPLPFLVREDDVTLITAEHWMLRVLDAPAAIAGRGYPAHAAVSAALTITDHQLPANSGDWRLEISGGAAALTRPAPGTPPAPGALRLGPRGLAALYAGTPLATLRLAGLAAAGTPGTDAALGDAFAATAWMTDSF